GVVRAGDDAFDLSLSELLDQEVTTVSRKSERLGDAPSAIYVLTADELSRLGVTSLPEALRHVPGVQVAALGRNRWAVSIRGFNGRFANRLQVLVDGRSVYSPLFSGTFWEALDIPLGDIERIEVVRGPGGAQWGANAVNGVINIITRHSRATRGTELRAATGNVSRSLMDLRHGGDWGEHGSYRITLRSRDDRAGDEVGGEAGNDSWRSTRLGLRADRDGIGGG
ncbi:MAG: TonB-dependent receptor plug domain-containing protein, partial [Rhodocyclaceae bacterium]|nr:TonB-dependent receptor plug domain-containing protein [Rhodocyclaceae bacterium]